MTTSPRFRQAVARLSAELLAVMSGVNESNVEEIFTSVIEKVAAEFPDVDMDEVAQVIDRMSRFALARNIRTRRCKTKPGARRFIPPCWRDPSHS